MFKIVSQCLKNEIACNHDNYLLPGVVKAQFPDLPNSAIVKQICSVCVAARSTLRKRGEWNT